MPITTLCMLAVLVIGSALIGFAVYYLHTDREWKFGYTGKLLLAVVPVWILALGFGSVFGTAGVTRLGVVALALFGLAFVKMQRAPTWDPLPTVASFLVTLGAKLGNFFDPVEAKPAEAPAAEPSAQDNPAAPQPPLRLVQDVRVETTEWSTAKEVRSRKAQSS